jgi:hypothetical protein
MTVLKTMVPAISVAGLLGSFSGGSAQESGTQPKAGVPVEKPVIEPTQEITATGCLSKEGDRFVLKDVAVEIRPWLAPTLRNNTVPVSSKPSPSKTVFALQNPQGLQTHVGHTIQVRGVVAPATANLPPSPDTIAPTRGFTAVPQPTFPGPQAIQRYEPPGLDNKDVRLIASSCSQAVKPTTSPGKQEQQ